MTATGVLDVTRRGVPFGWDSGFLSRVTRCPPGVAQGIQRCITATDSCHLGIVPPGMAINPRRSDDLAPWRDGNVRWVFLFDGLILTLFLVVLQSLSLRLIFAGNVSGIS